MALTPVLISPCPVKKTTGKERGIGYPIIVVSAIDDETTRHAAYELGVRFFLRKPVDDQALLDAITWVMSERHG